MKSKPCSRRFTPLVAAAGLLAAGLSTGAHAAPGGNTGYVYTESNAAAGNEVLVYARGPDGRLDAAAAYPTGGAGSGGGLGSQGAVVLDDAGKWLLAVDAGSNEISVFAVTPASLAQTDRHDSGGQRPISVTINDDLVYALNAGSDNIAGFRLDKDGTLSPLPGSQRPLSAAGADPAQVQLNPRGDLLVVTEKATNNVVVFPVGDDGLPGAPSVNAAPTPTPFGFAFGKRNQVFVSEAAGGAPGASTLSSWQLQADASATLVTPSAPTGEASACWVVVTQDGRLAFTANTGASSISAFRIAADGALTLIDGVAAAVPPGSAPGDMARSRDSRYLYALTRGAGTITAFRVGGDGSLQEVQTFSAGFPASTAGLAAQ